VRRFLITSSLKFTGEIELVYGADETLMGISFVNASMSAEVKQHFVKEAGRAVVFNNFVDVFNSSHLTIVEGTFEISFDMFWQKYDKKINRKRCEPLWLKMNMSDRVSAFMGIDAYNKYLRRDSWRTKADPEKYLRDRYWENEWK
jgi:hypothetical protein